MSTAVLASTTASASPTDARRPIWTGQGQFAREGAGVRNIVAIGASQLPDLDPFLIFAEFGGDGPEDYAGGFPDHPHRGFETATYVLEGRLRHWDSRGHKGRLGPGAVQWMTAARGIVHAEMPDQTQGRLRAFQLWINLPARHKGDEPRYQDVGAERIPEFESEGVKGRVLVGRAFGQTSPIQGGPTDPLYLDLALSSGASIAVPLPREHTAFAYVTDGVVRFGDQQAGPETITVFSPGGLIAVAADGPARLLLLAAAPIREPVARRGPFVMNTEEELSQAFADYQAGRLG